MLINMSNSLEVAHAYKSKKKKKMMVCVLIDDDVDEVHDMIHAFNLKHNSKSRNVNYYYSSLIITINNQL